jgi:acyl-CoA synthetase (AMP-forming)/AMP-acid ligase II
MIPRRIGLGRSVRRARPAIGDDRTRGGGPSSKKGKVGQRDIGRYSPWHMNFADIWEAVAAHRPDAAAQIHGDAVSSFRDFEDRAARLAGVLGSWGVGRDTKVALYLFNCNEYLETVFAAMKIRAVPVNVNYRYLADELHYLLDNSDAEVVVYHGALADRVAAVRARLPRLRRLVQVDTAPEDRIPLLDGALSYEGVVRTHDPAPRVERSVDDRIFLYTGGTTGLPKGVMWSHRALYAQLSASYLPLGTAPPATLAEVAAACDRLDAIGGGGPGLAAAPLMHGMAWFSSMGRLMIGGAVISLTQRSFDAHEFWRAVVRHRVAAATIVGDAFARPLVAALEEAERRGKPYEISSLQMIVSGGVMWTPPYKQPFLDRGVAMLIDGLGASEATGAGMMISTPGQDLATARFQLGADARVITDDGRDVRAGSGEVGVIAITGDALPDGYYKDEAKSATTFRTIDGRRYAIPGDFATVEADGTITLRGRGSVCINTGGEKVFPEEVEEAIKLHAAVADCTVVGVPDPRWGQAVTAVVQLAAGRAAEPRELIEHAKARLAAYKAPKHVVCVDRLVRSPAGKTDYRWALDRAKAALGLGD